MTHLQTYKLTYKSFNTYTTSQSELISDFLPFCNGTFYGTFKLILNISEKKKTVFNYEKLKEKYCHFITLTLKLTHKKRYKNKENH